MFTIWMGDRFVPGLVHKLWAVSSDSKPCADSMKLPAVIPEAYACTKITYTHVKDPVVHVNVGWMMERQIYPACAIATKYST